jgi:hypothetical protein
MRSVYVSSHHERITIMKNKLLSVAGALALLAVLGHFYAKPLLAQVRAALIQNIDEPARNPIGFSDNNAGAEDFWKVPAAKRYVIEQYTAFCETSSTGQLTSAEISVFTGGARVSATTPAFVSFTISDGNVVWAASATTRLYADPSSTITIIGVGNPSPNCSFQMSGYSVNLP